MNYEPSQSINLVWYVSATELRKLPLKICTVRFCTFKTKKNGEKRKN